MTPAPRYTAQRFVHERPELTPEVVLWRRSGLATPRDASWGFVVVDGARRHVRAGDWIVRHDDGRMQVMTPAEYEAFTASPVHTVTVEPHRPQKLADVVRDLAALNIPGLTLHDPDHSGVLAWLQFPGERHANILYALPTGANRALLLGFLLEALETLGLQGEVRLHGWGTRLYPLEAVVSEREGGAGVHRAEAEAPDFTFALAVALRTALRAREDRESQAAPGAP